MPSHDFLTILIILHREVNDGFLKFLNEIHFGILHQDEFWNFRTKMHFGVFAPRLFFVFLHRDAFSYFCEIVQKNVNC